MRYLCCAAVLFFSNRSLSSGERDSRFFLCAAESMTKTCAFFIGREGLLISFHCCRICFQILFEETFSMIFNLSGCSSAENSCNLNAIIFILFIFLHTYLVFVLHQSSFNYIIDWKTSGYIIS